MKLEVVYLLSEKGRKKSIMAGGDGKHIQQGWVEATPDRVEYARVHDDGRAVLNVGHEGVIHDHAHPTIVKSQIVSPVYTSPFIQNELSTIVMDTPVSFEEAADQEVLRRRALEKEERTEEERLVTMVAEWEKGKREEATENLAKFLNDGTTVVVDASTWLTEDQVALYRAKKKENTRLYELDQAAKKKTAKEERERARVEKLEEASTWVKEKGSERLKLAMALGCLEQSWNVYLEERLESEFPGFRYDSDWEENERINPTLEDLQELESVRTKVPEAELKYAIWWEDGEKEGAPVITLEFLERTVIKELSERKALRK